MYEQPIPNVSRDQCAVGFGSYEFYRNKKVKISDLPIATRAKDEDWLEVLHDGNHYQIQMKNFPLKPGKNGLMPFEIARICGYLENEEDFLNDLKGKNGKDGLPGESGDAGLSAYELAVKMGFRGNEVAFRSYLENKSANPEDKNQAFGRINSKWQKGPYVVNKDGKIEFRGNEFYFSFEYI